MLSVAHICRCSQPLRVVPSQLLSAPTRIVTRQLIIPARLSKNGFGPSGRGLKISELVRSNGIIARFCTSGPKPKQSKAVGYWLLGCSGMVFTAVVLGMVGGYLVLLYSVYYVVNVVVTTTNGSK